MYCSPPPTYRCDVNVSVILPVYNEEPALTEQLALICGVMCRYEPFEIIAVDDGSTDASFDVLIERKKSIPQLTVVRLVAHAGKSAALDAGFNHATGETIVTLDADLQCSVDDIPRLITALNDADLVSGRRTQRADPWTKRLASRLANMIRRVVLRDGAADSASPMKAFRRKVLEQIVFQRGTHRFLPALATIHGFRVVEVDVRFFERRYGASKYSTWGRGLPTLFDLIGMWWLKRRRLHYQIESVH